MLSPFDSIRDNFDGGVSFVSNRTDYFVVLGIQDQVGILRGHTEAVTSIVLNGNQLISASEDKTVRFWDLKVREEVDFLRV